MFSRLTTCLLILMVGLTACGAQPAQVAQEQGQARRATTTPRPTRVRATRVRPSATAQPLATARSSATTIPKATATVVKATPVPQPNQEVRQAFNQNAQATVYRLKMSYNNASPSSNDEDEVLVEYHVVVNHDDYSVRFNSPAYSSYGSSAVAMMHVDGTNYIRGPYPQEGLDQPVWYNVGRKTAGQTPFTAQMLFNAFRKGANFASLQQDGNGDIAGQTCGRYLGDQEFTRGMMTGLYTLGKPDRQANGGSKPLLRPGEQDDSFRNAQTSIWVCPDGYVRRLEIVTSSPEAEEWVGSYSLMLVFEMNDIDGQIEISAPAEAVQPGAHILSATVSNGGNVREQPSLQGRVLDQVHADEMVRLLGKSRDGRWYHVTNQRDISGWVSATLLTVEPEVARSVPVQ